MISLAMSLKTNSTVLSLNVSSNGLSDECAPSIYEMLSKNSTLRELYFRWNKITHFGGSYILQGIEEKENLAVLDLSYNNLGQRPKFSEQRVQTITTTDEFVPKLCKILPLPCLSSLLHLDLSYNGFQQQESMEIAEALKENHTLYGFHFDGNFGNCNS